MLRNGQIAKLLYNVDMKKLFKLLICACFIFFTAQMSPAEEYKVLVLPDNIQFDSTNYLVYPDSSVVFASDTINELKKSGKVETVSMTEVRDTLRKNTHISVVTKKALKEFKYNYNIPFVDFKEIAHCFSTNKVLVITSQTDIQNYFLRRTIWDFLNIPGCTVIDPVHRLSTYAALIDVDKEIVIWENTYYKNIGSMESRIIPQNFAPATEQLQKIKFYSTYFLSPQVAGMVQAKILPPPLVNPQGNNIIDVTDIKSVMPVGDDNLTPKIITPIRIKSNGYGAAVNDL
jgi:hypothetical protein